MRNTYLVIVAGMILMLFSSELFAQAVVKSGKPKKVLMVGGGSSHDYQRWYKNEDTKFLDSFDHLEVQYTENTDSIAHYLKSTDLLILVNNQEIAAPSKVAIEKFIQKGKPMIMMHAAVWYNWNDWPKYNFEYVGGGSKSHEKVQEFKNLVVNNGHAITKNVSPQFNFQDELYRHEPDPAGKGIDVLVIGESLETGKVYPAVFTVNHPKSRLVGITQGHDQHSHLNKDYKAILINSVNWALKL